MKPEPLIGRQTVGKQQEPSSGRPESLRWGGGPQWSVFFAAALLIMVVWLAAIIYYGGANFLTVLFAGRSRAVDRLYGFLPVAIPVLPVASAAVAAYGRLCTEEGWGMSGLRRAQYWLVIAMCAAPSLGVGNRRFIIPVLIAGLIGSFRSTSEKKLGLLPALAGVGVFLLLAVLPFVRSAGSRAESADVPGAVADYSSQQGLQGVLNNFFVSYDTEMFNYIAYVAPRLGDSLPYGYGRGTGSSLF